MKNLTRDQMIRLSIHPSADNVTYDKEVLRVSINENSEINLFLQPLTIERSPKDNRIISMTGIAIDDKGAFRPHHIQFPRDAVIFSYHNFSIGSDSDLDALERAFEDYDRLRIRLGIAPGESHLPPTRRDRRW